MAGRSWNDASYLSSSPQNGYSGMSKSYGYGAPKPGAGRGYPASYNNSTSYNTRARRDFSVRQKHSSLYDSLGSNGHDGGGIRDGRSMYRSSSPKLYRGNKIDSEMSSVIDRIKSSPSNNWRSKSWETSTNGARERSISRDTFSAREPQRSGDYSTFGRESSLIRDRLRDRPLSTRAYTPPRDYARIRTVGRDPYPLPPAASKKPEYYSSMTKPPAQDPISILTTSTDSNANARVRSNSFSEIKDNVLPSQITASPRRRHQTLTFGVSENDLDRARSVVNSTRRLSDDMRAPISGESYSKKSTFRHSLPDVFDGISSSALNYSRQYNMADLSLPSRSLASSGSAHVSFLSPAVESVMQLPSYSSSNMTSSLPTFPSSLSPMYPSPSPNTSMLNQSHIAQPYLSPSRNSSSSSQNFNLPKTGGQNDETFKLLQKHYMDAIHTLTPQQKLNDLSSKTELMADKSVNDQSNDSESKKPTQLIDDILKLWEESQAENSRLRLEMNSLRMELESTKHQLENAFQTSTNNSVSDNQKEEKIAMEKKLSEMEDKIKLLTMTDTVTDQTLSQLKSDNSRLREENAGLIRVMSKLSK